jgi:hypothetical protein
MLGVVTLAELLGMSLWFAASAVSGQYAAQWSLSTGEAAWLTTIVQLGFVAGTAISALLNVADIVPARLLFACCAMVGAVANTMLLTADGLTVALLWRFVTGFALAGVYPPAMKMMATWFRAQRGLAVGTVVGALTVGKAMPYLVHAIPGAGITPVVLSASIGACGAALLVWFLPVSGACVFVASRARGGVYPGVASFHGWVSGAHVRAVRRVDLVAGVHRGQHGCAQSHRRHAR